MFLPSIFNSYDIAERRLFDIFDEETFPNFQEENGSYSATFLKGVDVDTEKLEIEVRTYRGVFPTLTVKYDDENFHSSSSMTLPEDADLETIESEITDEGVIVKLKKVEKES